LTACDLVGRPAVRSDAGPALDPKQNIEPISEVDFENGLIVASHRVRETILGTTGSLRSFEQLQRLTRPIPGIARAVVLNCAVGSCESRCRH
jgi:hypothetical protein